MPIGGDSGQIWSQSFLSIFCRQTITLGVEVNREHRGYTCTSTNGAFVVQAPGKTSNKCNNAPRTDVGEKYFLDNKEYRLLDARQQKIISG